MDSKISLLSLQKHAHIKHIDNLGKERLADISSSLSDSYEFKKKILYALFALAGTGLVTYTLYKLIK